MLNELKGDWNTHVARTTTRHRGFDRWGTISTANSTTTATAITLANALRTQFNRSGLAGADPGAATNILSATVMFALFLDSSSV
jgi:hypothetical protein